MRLAFLLLLAALTVAGTTGCRHFNLHKCNSCGTQVGGGLGQRGPLAALRGRHKSCGPNCTGTCGPEGCGPLSRLHNHAAAEEPAYAPGPPTAAYAYPYYTTRGPRDFLQNNPTSIGP